MEPGIDLRKRDGGVRHRFDYKGMHRYLITMTTFRLGRVFVERELVLRLLDVLRESCWKHHFDVYAYCCLPQQCVLLVRGKTEYADMKAFVATFRRRSTEVLGSTSGIPLWKRAYTERVLRRKEDSKLIAAGIYELPVKAGLASSPGEYPFQGSFVIGDRRRTPASPSSPSRRRRPFSAR
jgi:REP element-mobilizing transposase RayT